MSIEPSENNPDPRLAGADSGHSAADGEVYSRAGKWLLMRGLRLHPAAAPPAGTPLSEPPESLNAESAKAALEQVNKLLDAQLALKGTTEARALTLAGQCLTLLSALTAWILFQFYASPAMTVPRPLMAAAVTGAVFLFLAVLCAYRAAAPREEVFLPGRLPEEVWGDLLDPRIHGPEFMARLMYGNQDGMVKNRQEQRKRATQLQYAIWIVVSAVPAAVLVWALAPVLGSHMVSAAQNNPAPPRSTMVTPLAPAPVSSPPVSRSASIAVHP